MCANLKYLEIDINQIAKTAESHLRPAYQQFPTTYIQPPIFQTLQITLQTKVNLRIKKINKKIWSNEKKVVTLHSQKRDTLGIKSV